MIITRQRAHTIKTSTDIAQYHKLPKKKKFKHHEMEENYSE